MVTGAENQKTGENGSLRLRNVAKPALLLLAGLTLAASVHFANPAPVSAYQGELPDNPVSAEDIGVRTDFDLDLQGAESLEEFIKIQEAKDLLLEKYHVSALDSQSDPRDPSLVWVDVGDGRKLFPQEGFQSGSWTLGELEELINIFEIPALHSRVNGDLWLIRLVNYTGILGSYSPNELNRNTIMYTVDPDISLEVSDEYPFDITWLKATILHEWMHLILDTNISAAGMLDYYRSLMMNQGVWWISYKDYVGIDVEEGKLLNRTNLINRIYTSEEVDKFRKRDQKFQDMLKTVRNDSALVLDLAAINPYDNRPGSVFVVFDTDKSQKLVYRIHGSVDIEEMFADRGVLFLLNGGLAEGCFVPPIPQACEEALFFDDLISSPKGAQN